MEFPLPHLEADSWAYAKKNANCDSGENVVRVRERLRTKIKLFLSYFFAF